MRGSCHEALGVCGLGDPLVVARTRSEADASPSAGPGKARKELTVVVPRAV